MALGADQAPALDIGAEVVGGNEAGRFRHWGRGRGRVDDVGGRGVEQVGGHGEAGGGGVGAWVAAERESACGFGTRGMMMLHPRQNRGATGGTNNLSTRQGARHEAVNRIEARAQQISSPVVR